MQAPHISTQATQDRAEAYDPDGPNPFDDVEFLPGLGLAVLCVVLAFVLVNWMLPGRPL